MSVFKFDVFTLAVLIILLGFIVNHYITVIQLFFCYISSCKNSLNMTKG
jgi:hypothetical protein